MNELLYLQAKMGDSMSCMSLSISLRKSTVISRFPLMKWSRNLMSASHTHFFQPCRFMIQKPSIIKVNFLQFLKLNMKS